MAPVGRRGREGGGRGNGGVGEGDEETDTEWLPVRHRGEGRREVRPPARFSQENRTRIPAPVGVRRPARGAAPPSPRPRPSLSNIGGGIPRLRVTRVEGGGDAAWTSEVRNEAERVEALVSWREEEEDGLGGGARARWRRVPGQSQDYLNRDCGLKNSTPPQ